MNVCISSSISLTVAYVFLFSFVLINLFHLNISFHFLLYFSPHAFSLCPHQLRTFHTKVIPHTNLVISATFVWLSLLVVSSLLLYFFFSVIPFQIIVLFSSPQHLPSPAANKVILHSDVMLCPWCPQGVAYWCVRQRSLLISLLPSSAERTPFAGKWSPLQAGKLKFAVELSQTVPEEWTEK